MPRKKKLHSEPILRSRIGYISLLALFAFVCFTCILFLKSKEIAFDFAFMQSRETPLPTTTKEEGPEAFPVGVDPINELVIESPALETFLEENYAPVLSARTEHTWFTKVLARLSTFSWYQNLASPISRILIVDSGERKEEIVKNWSDILNWDEKEAEHFEELVRTSAPQLADGKFFPGSYVLSKDATPEDAAYTLIDAFNRGVLSRYPEEVDSVVPIEDALTIASLLEREAYDFEDMRHISGVIWNRLFIDMDLQLDATLQYARANKGGTQWWPVARPQDKYIDSPYNTYQNEGLPPAPIANPSPEAIIAALNPKKTDCLFYFHDSDGGFHCTETYEEHVALLKVHYGRGR